MALNIKHPEAERLARELAAATGENLTEAVVNALRERLMRQRGKVRQPSVRDELRAIRESHQHVNVAQRFNSFLTDVVLREIPERVVIFVDEIDTTPRLDFTDDFFASIRYLYNARATTKALARLSFVLLGVASPGDLMKDPERTPFNIGQRPRRFHGTRSRAGPPRRTRTCQVGLPLHKRTPVSNATLLPIAS